MQHPLAWQVGAYLVMALMDLVLWLLEYIGKRGHALGSESGLQCMVQCMPCCVYPPCSAQPAA